MRRTEAEDRNHEGEPCGNTTPCLSPALGCGTHTIIWVIEGYTFRYWWRDDDFGFLEVGRISLVFERTVKAWQGHRRKGMIGEEEPMALEEFHRDCTGPRARRSGHYNGRSSSHCRQLGHCLTTRDFNARYSWRIRISPLGLERFPQSRTSSGHIQVVILPHVRREFAFTASIRSKQTLLVPAHQIQRLLMWKAAGSRGSQSKRKRGSKYNDPLLEIYLATGSSAFMSAQQNVFHMSLSSRMSTPSFLPNTTPARKGPMVKSDFCRHCYGRAYPGS